MPIKHLEPHPVMKNDRKRGFEDPRIRRWAMRLGLGVGAAAIVGFFVLTLTLAWLSRDLPNPNALLAREVAQSTKIFDRTGEVLLYEIHGDEQRTLVTIDEIPDIMKWATIAIEDKDFYKHKGVSWKGLIRAFLTSVIKRQRVQGTSTLTQQFVKNAILTNERSVTRKLKELLLSLQIERTYSKDQILQLYLNEIPYGSTLYGVESASQGYFGKSVRDITLDEAALLAALPQAPSLYNPYGTGASGDTRERLVGRQHYILGQMRDQGFITTQQMEEAQKVDTLSKLVPRQVGNIKAPHFVMWVRDQLVETFGQRTVETGGLRVVTTLDWRLQQAAEAAVKDVVEKKGSTYKFSNAALVAIGPKDGHVLAMVGSKDFFDETIDGQVNVTVRLRQPGSSFKPFVYAMGFMRGYTPETTLWDVNTVFKTDTRNYEPKNYNLKQNGPVSIRRALQGSLNIPAVKMLYLVGVGNVLDFAESLGYTTFGDRSRFGLSLVLGGGEVKLVEHTAAYGAFANEGVLHPTTGILKVEGPSGNLLEEWRLGEGRRVMEAQISRQVSDVLSDDASRAYIFGAGSALTLPGRPAAAKTGTTNDYRDAWTLGYTPSLVAGVWAGNNDNSEMAPGGGGSASASPIWQKFMIEATKGTPVEAFTEPAPPDTDKAVLIGKAFEKEVEIDAVTGKLATEFTPPEYRQKLMFREAHSILHYVDKDNPRGPVPTRPESDPQYFNWEKGVSDWVADPKNEWNSVTGTPPIEYDDVHTAANAPTVRLTKPGFEERLGTRSFTIEADVTAMRRIQSVTAFMGGFTIGTAYAPAAGSTWRLEVTAPNALEKGYHDIILEARDDVGNRGRDSRTVNLLADAVPVVSEITNIAPGSSLTLNDFPKSVEARVNDLSDVVRADLRLVAPDGTDRLIGSSIQPTENPIVFSWAYTEGPGLYNLYIRTAHTNGATKDGDRLSITVLPATPESQDTTSG
jgi:penicillin-binding protein 1C